MAFPPSFLDELAARNPIEDVVGQYVSLKRSGSNLFGLCPFHGEKTASFSVAPDKGIYYCFGCHKGGSAINFVMEIEGLSYPDAVRSLAKRAGMEVPEDEQYQSRYKAQERLWALHKEAARFFHSQLNAPAGKAALDYALGRGMPKSTLIKFGIGYAPDSWDLLVKAMRAKGYTDQELKDSGLVTVSQKNGNIFDRFRDRLMFPIIDVRGNVIGFGGRIMSNDKNTAKYLNSPETLIFNKRKNLFGLNVAKKTKLPYMILVEGYMDAIALHQYGFDCAVASLGTSLTEEHAVLLGRYTENVVLIYDGDEAGQRAAQRAIPMLEKAGLNVKVLTLKDAKDPDEYLKKFGADRFQNLLNESSNRVEYQLGAIRKKYDLNADEDRVKFVQEAAELICTLPGVTKREVYGNRVAETAKISNEAMKLEIERARKRIFAREKRKQEQIDLTPASQLQRKAGNRIPYDNVKSARAEEYIVAALLLEPALVDQCGALEAKHFSVPLFQRVYQQIREQIAEGFAPTVGSLTELSAEEMSHVVQIYQSQTKVNEQALRDCVSTVLSEHRAGQVESVDDLMALREKMKERKGIKA